MGSVAASSLPGNQNNTSGAIFTPTPAPAVVAPSSARTSVTSPAVSSGGSALSSLQAAVQNATTPEASRAAFVALQNYQQANPTSPSGFTGTIPQGTPVGTMNAVITQPNPNAPKVPAPVVLTADAAEKNVQNIKAQVDQLTKDVAAHKAAMSTPQTPVTTGSATDTNPAAVTGPQGTGTLDDKINSVLNTLTGNDATIDADETAALTPIQAQQAALQKQSDAATITALNQLNSIASGTYPLSPSEQALLDSTKASYLNTIQGQGVANDAFTGQMTELAASLGIQTSSPAQAAGMIHAAISQGSDKVAELNGQMAQSLATVQQGFQKNDFDMVQSAWTDTAKYYDDRLKTLSDMQTAVMDAAKQQKSDQKDQTTLVLTAMMDSANYDYKAKQDAIDNALKADQISETQRHDLATEALSSSASGLGTAGTPVPLSTNGAPNKAAQTQWLSQFPANLQTQIVGLANYQLLPTSFPTRAAAGEIDRATAVALAKQYDPTYDENLAASRQKVATTYTDGTSAPSKSILALNTAAGHLATLAADSQKLGNVGFEPANYLKNTVGGALGFSGNAGAKLDIGAVTGELAAAFKSSGATDQEIKSLGTIDSNSSPEQVKSYIESATSLMGSKLSALQDSYTSAMGVPPSQNFLHDSAATDLLTLQQQGYKINVPQLEQTAPVQLKNFVAADSGNSQVYDQAKQAIMQVNGGQAPSADDIYQFLQAQGYIQ